jgi:hypothetical protein
MPLSLADNRASFHCVLFFRNMSTCTRRGTCQIQHCSLHKVSEKDLLSHGGKLSLKLMVQPDIRSSHLSISLLALACQDDTGRRRR